jgi:hypothetical protein
MNIIVLAIKPMQPDDPQFPVRVELNWGPADEIVSNATITVEVWLDKDDVGEAPLQQIHDRAIEGALKLLERALDSVSSANVVTGF